MASHNVSDEYFLRTLQTLEQCGGNKAECGRRLGISPTTVRDHISSAKRRGLKAPEEFTPSPDAALLKTIEALRSELDLKAKELEEARASLRIATKPRFTVRTDSLPRGSKIRLVCIGDAHDSPEIPDKSRFRHIGNYIKAIKPDVVVQIGDFATLDSLNAHVPNETYAGKSKPTYMADMESFNNALGEMDLPDGLERHCTLGNHERRLYLFEEKAPEAYGMMQCELQKIFERHKWTFSPYGQITFYGGVGFLHAAINRMGKTFGGKTAENTIANEALCDIVIGHSHIRRSHKAPKIGGDGFIQVFNVGCALPDQHIEPYAKHALNGWSWGISDFVIQGGHVQDERWVSMAQLEEDYA